MSLYFTSIRFGVLSRLILSPATYKNSKPYYSHSLFITPSSCDCFTLKTYRKVLKLRRVKRQTYLVYWHIYVSSQHDVRYRTRFVDLNKFAEKRVASLRSSPSSNIIFKPFSEYYIVASMYIAICGCKKEIDM